MSTLTAIRESLPAGHVIVIHSDGTDGDRVPIVDGDPLRFGRALTARHTASENKRAG